MAFNKDELVSPPWMDKVFFEKKLRETQGDPNFVISAIDIKPGSSVGDHLASVLYRVTIDYDSPKYHKVGERLVVIAKTLPFVEGPKRNMLLGSPFFPTEIRMYKIVLPEMERLFALANVESRFFPEFICGEMEPEPILILKDITQRGFKVPKAALDFPTAVRMAKWLGQFHACSMEIQRSEIDLGDFDKSIFTENPKMGPGQNFQSMMTPFFKLIIDEIESWDGFDKQVEKLRDLCGPESYKIFARIYTSTEKNGYNVLNHGDFHFKNLMANYANGEEDRYDEIILLDYQISIWGTPALDIIYFLFMMVSFETRSNHRSDLVKIYHDEFVRTLKVIGYLGKIPTLVDLNVELTKNGVHEILLATVFMMFHFIDFTDVEPSDIFNQKTDPFAIHRKILKNPKYQEIIKAELPRWLNMGFLDARL